MRVPTRSAGSRSGVNWMRANVPPTTVASVSTASVLARPGTPSSRHVAPASRHDHQALDHAVLPDDDVLDLEQCFFDQLRGTRFGQLGRHCHVLVRDHVPTPSRPFLSALGIGWECPVSLSRKGAVRCGTPRRLRVVIAPKPARRALRRSPPRWPGRARHHRGGASATGRSDRSARTRARRRRVTCRGPGRPLRSRPIHPR